MFAKAQLILVELCGSKLRGITLIDSKHWAQRNSQNYQFDFQHALYMRSFICNRLCIMQGLRQSIRYFGSAHTWPDCEISKGVLLCRNFAALVPELQYVSIATNMSKTCKRDTFGKQILTTIIFMHWNFTRIWFWFDFEKLRVLTN